MSTNINDKHGATDVVSADEAIKRLREGNARYLEAKTAQGNVSPQIRRSTFEEGQHPFAIVLACSDSRVIPEAIFSAGIGDLFTIRVAGNVVDNHQLGSVEYAESHLNCKLVVVLGHTGCGAVDAVHDIGAVLRLSAVVVLDEGHDALDLALTDERALDTYRL